MDVEQIIKNAVAAAKTGNLGDTAKALHLDTGARWLSSRNIITLGAVVALIWLFKGAIGTVLWPIVALIGLNIICRTVTDAVTVHANGKVRAILAKNLTKDGTLTEGELIDITA